jgi:phage gp45-like
MKTSRSLGPTLAGALLAFGVATASAQVAAKLTGHIRSVDPQANRLVVKQTGTGDDVPVTVNQQTQIITTANKIFTLKDLTVGDGVVVTHSGGLASRIVVNPAPLNAIVKAIDPGARRLVVVRPGSDAELTFLLGDRSAIVTTGNAALKIMDLKQGDRVAITRDGELVQRVEVFPKPQEITGHVKSVAANYKTFVVTETGTKKDITVEVNDDTKIENTEGKPLPIKHLKKGDGVGIAHEASVAKSIVVNVRP